MSTHANQWHKATDGLWYCWKLGESPPGNLPACGTAGLVLTADVFNHTVTLEDMAPGSRDFHLSKSSG